MKYCMGIQVVEVFEDDYIIKSSADGVTNVEEIIWLKNKLIEIAQNWRGKKWGYIADISKLQTVSIEISSVLVNLHTEIFENGCSCVGFVEPINAFISRQAAVHNRLSDAELQEGHFHDFDEAFNWAKNIIAS
ncbi:MAG: hypothetical protein J6R03_02600 [Treponema sp.]|nr:hypothetical protein [Treponema sp.]